MSPTASWPEVRGTLMPNVPLKDMVWFRAGGAAQWLFRPADIEDLCAFTVARPPGPVSVIGVGSNLLVRDGGIDGVVVRLPASFARVEHLGDTRIRAGAAALDATVAKIAASFGIGGLEFLRTIPGTLGGALKMNAGCYGAEIKDVFVEARAVNGAGRVVTLSATEMGFTYRHSAVADDLIFVDAVLQGVPAMAQSIIARMEELQAQREATQPMRAKTGGSTFKNPPGHKAWELIDRAGCRGLTIGAAQVSQKHTNFLINLGDANAADIERLGEEVRARVKKQFGIELEWEIKRLGRPVDETSLRRSA